MQTTTLNLYSLGYTQLKTYLIAIAFVVGYMNYYIRIVSFAEKDLIFP